MLRRTRLRLLPVVLVATMVALAGCGGENSSSASSSDSALDAVTITGDVGTAPDVTWDSKMTATEVHLARYRWVDEHGSRGMQPVVLEQVPLAGAAGRLRP